MPNQYRALVAFTSPADPDSLKKRRAAVKLDPGQKRDDILAQVKYMDAKAGDKVTPYSDEILEAWLASGLVEEVKANG